MADINKSIKWMKDHHRHKTNIRYSMTTRYLNPNLDCSSAIFYALKAGGFLPKNQSIGNTETLFALAKQGYFKEIYSYKDIKPGDIFIRGGEGTSLGAAGHTGMFLDKNTIIHCNYYNNGVSINDRSTIGYFLNRKRSNNERYFRPIVKGASQKPSKSPSKPKPQPAKAKLVKHEKHSGWTQAWCNVRSEPNTSSAIVASYAPNQKINYDQVWEGGGYRWISYIGSSGKRRYVAYGKLGSKNSWIYF